MKRIIVLVASVLALGACSAMTAPHRDTTCKSGYIMSSGDKCIPQ